MGDRPRRIALVFVPLCSGAGLLALAVGQFVADPPAPLPPPFFSTLPNLPPQIILSNPNTLAAAPAISMAAQPYRHPSGAFSIYYPDSWQIDESEDSAQFTAPDDSGQFSVTVVPGEAVPDGEYERDLRQTWGDETTFIITATEAASDPHRWAAAFTFQRTFPPEPGTVAMNGYAYYIRHGDVLYIATLEVQASAAEPLLAVLKSALETLETDPRAAFDDSE